jgi:hypothetical protein
MKGLHSRHLPAAITILVLVAMVIAQQSSSVPVKPDKMVGAAEVYHFKDKNKSRAQVRRYLLGQPEDIGTDKETLSMDVVFELDGQKLTQPKFVYVALSSYYPSKSKYQNDHDLRIYTDGLDGINVTTWHTRVLSSVKLASGGIQEIYLATIEYRKFLTIANARLVVVGLGGPNPTIGIIPTGGSGFKLTKEDMQALKDLLGAIEK